MPASAPRQPLRTGSCVGFPQRCPTSPTSSAFLESLTDEALLAQSGLLRPLAGRAPGQNEQGDAPQLIQ